MVSEMGLVLEFPPRKPVIHFTSLSFISVSGYFGFAHFVRHHPTEIPLNPLTKLRFVVGFNSISNNKEIVTNVTISLFVRDGT